MVCTIRKGGAGSAGFPGPLGWIRRESQRWGFAGLIREDSPVSVRPISYDGIGRLKSELLGKGDTLLGIRSEGFRA